MHYENKAQKLFMNFWQWSGGNGWGKDFDDSSMPWWIKYDSVKVESWDERTDSFALVFEDNFDTFDETRWTKIKGYGYDTTNFYESQTHVDKNEGTLVIRMERDYSNGEDDDG